MVLSCDAYHKVGLRNKKLIGEFCAGDKNCELSAYNNWNQEQCIEQSTKEIFLKRNQCFKYGQKKRNYKGWGKVQIALSKPDVPWKPNKCIISKKEDDQQC